MLSKRSYLEYARFVPAVCRPIHELKIPVSDRNMTYGAATGIGDCLLLEAIKLVSSERKEQ